MGQIVKVINNIFYKKLSYRITLIGLGGAGKTTLMHRMMGDSLSNIIPTMGFNVETFIYDEVEFNCWDLEGHGERIRDLWVHYYKDTRCILYVIDSNDKDCIEYNIYEIERVLKIEQAKGIPILFVANKQDIANSLTSKELIEIEIGNGI